MSEVLGNVILVSITVGLLGGFGALVLATVSSDTPTPPAASFTMAPELNATSVPVRLVSGAIIDPAGSTLQLHVNGADRTSGFSVLNASIGGRWSPGETLRVNVTGAPLAANDTLRFFAVDNASGKMIGVAYGTVSGTESGTVILRNTMTASLSFDRSPVVTDGASIVNATVTVTSSIGLSLVDRVSVNLSVVGGPASVVLYDDGAPPDLIAGDGLFSTSFSVTNHTYASSPGYANVSIPASVRDVLGRTAETTAPLALAAAPPSKVGPGVTYRRIGSSDTINTTGFINLSAFAFRDTSAVDSDQVELRVSDLDDSTKVWSALVSFANTGCPSPSVTSIVLRIDGVAGNVTYTPAGGCFPIGSAAGLNLANVAASRNATGATATWTAVGVESTYQYASAGISASNEALIAFFGDTLSSSPFARGLSQTDFSWAPPIPIANATVPAAIADLAATPGNAFVDLTWSAPAGGGAAITGYGIYRDGVLIDTIGTNTTYRAAGLTNGVLYSFDVRAINAVGTAPASNAATATPGTTPGAPTGLLPVKGNQTVALSWNAPIATGGSPIIDYQIYAGVTSGATTWLATTGGANTSFIVNGLTNGQQYFFNVTARNAVGQGTSGPQASSTPSTIPHPPDTLTATAGDARSTLSWALGQTGGSAITDHRIYRGTTSGATTLLASTGSGANTSFIDLTAVNGVTYYYNVTAINANGGSASSNEANATPASGTTVPGAPTSLAGVRANQSVVLTWSAPGSDGGSAITDYLVYVGTSSGGTTYLASTGGTNTTFTVNGLTNGQEYFFNVTALNSVGQSASSNEASATPAGVPYPPTNLVATRGNTSVSLTWTAPANTGGLPVTSYHIYRGTASGATTWIASTGGANTSFIVNGLINGQQYFFNVTAQNAAGQGAGSNEASAVPATVPNPPADPSATGGDQKVTLTWTIPSNGGSAITTYKIYAGGASGATTYLATTGSGANTSFIVNGLTHGQQYFFNLTAVNAIGESATSAQVTATPSGAPSAPISLGATKGNRSVSISWSAPASNGGAPLTTYHIYAGTTSGATTWLGTTGGTNTTFTVNSLTNGQQYFFNVTAANANGQGASSNEASATPSTVPNPPVNLVATGGNSLVSLSWSAPADIGGSAITNYHIYRGTSSGATTFIGPTGGANTSFVANGLTNGQPYFFNVTAVNANGQSASSNEATATPATVPSAPQSLVGTPANRSVALSWSAPASNGGTPVTNYHIYRGTSSGATTFLGSTGGSNTSFVANGLTNGQLYYFNVTAVNAGGQGPSSNEASATPSTIPNPPASLSAVRGNQSVTLSWAAPADIGGSAITGYNIYRGTSSGATTFLGTVGVTTSTVVSSLTNGQPYFFNVTAVNANGQSASSNEATATPATIPNPPATLTATAGNGQVSLSWTAGSTGGSAITNYQIWRGTTSGGQTLLTTIGTNTTFVDAAVTGGTPYFYQIRAVNAIGASSPSIERSATPPAAPVVSTVNCPATIVQGTIDVCANIQNVDGAFASLDESAGNPKLFDIRFTGSATTATGTHTLQLYGRQSASAEDLHVQVSTGPSTWRTVVTMPASGVVDTLYTNTITAGEFNGGAFTLRIVDDNTLNGGTDSPRTTWLVDYLRVVTT